MKNAIKNIVITFIIVATAIAVAEWTLNQIEEGYTPSYPTKLDKQGRIGAMYYVYYEYI